MYFLFDLMNQLWEPRLSDYYGHKLYKKPTSLPLSRGPEPLNSPYFRVNIDVQHFRSNELKVKLVDNFIVVEGKHEEQRDAHGFISRQFTRRCKLPEHTDLANITSKLSSDGILTIEAPEKAMIEVDRIIRVTHSRSPTPIKQDEKRIKLDSN